MKYNAEWFLNNLKSVIHYNELTWKSLLIFLAVPFVCLLVELLLVGWHNSSMKKLVKLSRSSQNDLACFIMHTFGLYQLVGIVFTLGIFYYAYGFIQKNIALNWIDIIPGNTAKFFFMLLVGDFKNYIRHFLLHRFGWAWQLHSFHHSAQEFTMLTYLRSHAAETVLTTFLDLFPFIIFGAKFETIAAVYIAREAHQYFIHSQLTSNWGFIGKYILVSPLAHRLHHSTNPLHYGKNLGNTFIFWDRLFGTYYMPEANASIEIGLPDNPYNKSNFFKDYITCYVNSLKSLRK
jgi:sterol desaturase/sphingolipid hydroxylase (fatty acid hydroxylase superfamily)